MFPDSAVDYDETRSYPTGSHTDFTIDDSISDAVDSQAVIGDNDYDNNTENEKIEVIAREVFDVDANLNKKKTTRMQKSRIKGGVDKLLEKVEMEHRYKILTEALNVCNEECKEEVLYTKSETLFKGKVCKAFITHLKSMKRDRHFYELIKNAFCEEIEDKSFRFWLCKKLCIDSNKFITSLSLWKENDFQEVRGRKSLSIDLKQMIYIMNG